MRTSLLVLILALGGCLQHNTVRLYAGPTLPDADTATIILPVEINLLEHNGEAIKLPSLSFRSQATPLVLPAAQHTFVVEVDRIWNIDNDNHERFTSLPVRFQAKLIAGEQYQLTIPPIASLEQMQTFVTAPKVYLTNKNKKILGEVVRPLENYSDEADAEPLSHDAYLEQLKFWWERATQSERESFLQWVTQPPNE